MGIERFFKSINSLYKNQFIKPIYKDENITHFYFDFNSIIHKVSANVVSDLNDLLLLSLIYKYSNFNGMDKDMLVDDYNDIIKNKNYDILKQYKINDFYKNTEFIKYKLLNHIIYDEIFKDIKYNLSFYPNCKFIYIGIDGVPSVGKMIEQQDRRYKGYIMGFIHSLIKEKYKNELNNTKFYYTNLYNEYEFLNIKFSFDKNLISPCTDFMVNFIEKLKKQKFGGNEIIISDFNEPGEGEKKIIIHIKKYRNIENDNIIIYSPDADMIIMSMILDHSIWILRHEQSDSTDAIINISSIKKEFSPCEDLAYLFSVFGDDFIPKISWINVTKHIGMIINEYKKMNMRIIENGKVNFLNLQLFFKQIKKLEKVFEHTKNRFTNNIEVVNYSSFKYYNELNDLEKLNKKYTPQYIEEENTIPALEYYKAMNWKYRYYFLDDETINDYYYPYDEAPTLDTLINYKFDVDMNTNELNLDKYKTTNLKPIEQLCFISPFNVSIYVENQKINKLLADKLYKLMKIELPKIYIDKEGEGDGGGSVNINEIFNCKNARYLNKCDLNFNIISFKKFTKILENYH
jgi:5'-3' exonuclease